MVPVSAPALPAVPKSTPMWLIHLVAFLLPIVGTAVVRYNVLHLNSSAAKAAVLVVFLVVAGAIWLYHTGRAAVHSDGWSLKALEQVDEASKSELSDLLDEARPLIATAKPILSSMPELGALVSKTTAVAARAEAAASKAEAVVPAADRTSALAELRALLDGAAPAVPSTPAPAPVTPAPVAEVVAPAVAPVEDGPTIPRAQATAEGAPDTAAAWNGKRIV